MYFSCPFLEIETLSCSQNIYVSRSPPTFLMRSVCTVLLLDPRIQV